MARWALRELHVGRRGFAADERDDRGERYVEDAPGALVAVYGEAVSRSPEKIRNDDSHGDQQARHGRFLKAE